MPPRKAPMKRSAIRRKPKSAADRITDIEAAAVFGRDKGCIALRYDPSHACFGRLTLAHVPKLGQNAYGMKPPGDRFHLVAECYGANSGGLQPWSELHRDVERAHLAKHYGERAA